MAIPDNPGYAQTVQQHLHDYRVNRTRGKQVTKIPRICIRCGHDCTPRYLYCSDQCAETSRAENSRKMWKR